MDKKKMALLILAGLAIAVAVLIYLNRRHLRKEEQEEGCPEFTPLYAGKPNVTSEDADMGKKVYLGDYGPEVAYLQERLNTQYGASVTVDGKFGCDTYEAVKSLTGLDSLTGIDLNDLK